MMFHLLQVALGFSNCATEHSHGLQLQPVHIPLLCSGCLHADTLCVNWLRPMSLSSRSSYDTAYAQMYNLISSLQTEG